MIRKIACAVLVIALPFLLEATTGCVLDATGLGCGPDCLKDPAESNPNSYVCSCTCAPASHHIERRVSTSADDAEEIANGSVVLTGLILDMGIPEINGIRFSNLAIPPGADILGAYVQFTAAADNTEVLSLEIVGEAADDAAPFTGALNDLSSRLTTSSINWVPPGWVADASGAAQQTPDLTLILQEIVDRPGWAQGNAIVLLVTGIAGADLRRAHSYDGNPQIAPQLVVDYRDTSGPMVGPQDLPVCVLPESNPNKGGIAKTDAELATDCEGRVEGTLQGLAETCGYPSDCDCNIQPGSQRFSDTCDAGCVENTVDMDCADFDPVAGIVEATNAPFDTPVCLANSPLASGLYGRRTACSVNGTADIQIDGESPDDTPAATGVLYFLGDPCPPGQSCAVGMEYRLNLGSVTFSSLFDSETFNNLASLGESLAGADAVLSPIGAGTFGSAACMVSARGTREGEQRALATTNNDVININVSFGSMAPMCSLSGALVGTADPEVKRCEAGGNLCSDDSECDDDDSCSEVGDSQLLLGLDVAGGIDNQPPTADAGDDQTVECPAPGILNATGSSDLDSNIALFSWRRGSRIGEEVGADEISIVQQGLGTETYVLRVIDAFGQADEDATDVTVEDTMPPELSCSVAVPVIQQTNHNMVTVGLASRARDLCEGELPVTASVFADEDDEMQTGDGNFSPDGKSIAVDFLRLRAERRGDSDGRVYLILVEASDSSGNRGFNCCTVAVPHSRAQKALQSVQAQAAAAQASCLANGGAAPAGYFPIGDGPVIGPKQ
jgi:hypothetical protein